MLSSTDTVLTRRAAAGDRAAFEIVYAASVPCVWAFAVRRVHARAAAERLADRILARAFTELDGYDGSVPFAAWLHGLAQRVAARDLSRPLRALRDESSTKGRTG
jgi:DNA-directed RNA polymerase specialized sigma24 family protein